MCGCVCGDQMKYSSASVAIDQRAAAPVMDSTALIAPLFLPLCFSHTFSARLSLTHSSLFPPPIPFCGAQTETNQGFNEMKFRGGEDVCPTPPDSSVT